MTVQRWASTPTSRVVGVVVCPTVAVALLLASVGPASGAAGTPERLDPDAASRATIDRPSAPAVVARLDRALENSVSVHLRGRLTVASLGEGGPQVTTVEVARRPDGRLRATRQGAWELGRDDDGTYLRSDRTGRLLELGGVSVRSFDRSRFLEHYHVADRGAAEVDTGPARVLAVIERERAIVREILHLDDETGLVVRRETRGHDGEPLRVVAYTRLEVDDDVRAVRTPQEGLEPERVALDPVERRVLTDRGVPAVDELPGGFELLDAAEVRDTDTDTVHLAYGDGLYTLSVYVQDGRLARRAIRSATRLELDDDAGAVWRWPGSEPRRVIWSGEGRTFTAVTDAPTDVLLAAVSGLPNDPPPSTLDRLIRGLARVGDRLMPPYSDT